MSCLSEIMIMIHDYQILILLSVSKQGRRAGKARFTVLYHRAPLSMKKIRLDGEACRNRDAYMHRVC